MSPAAAIVTTCSMDAAGSTAASRITAAIPATAAPRRKPRIFARRADQVGHNLLALGVAQIYRQ